MAKLPKIQLGQKPTYVKFAEDVDFLDLFKKIERHSESCFIFESLGEEGKFSRYSILGFDPEHIISGRGNTLTVDGEVYEVENPYLALRDMMPAKTLGREYAGGLIGYLSYEALMYFEPSLKIKTHDTFEQFMFGVYTDGLIHDKLTNELIYFYYETDRSALLHDIHDSELPKGSFKATFVADGLSESEHSKIVEDVKDLIRAGNTFQCEVGFKSKYKVEGNSLHVYERLREVNPSPFMYFVKFGDPSTGSGQEKKIIGASPELLFSLREGGMTTRPLAGK